MADNYVVTVSKERWEKAQEWERHGWIKKQGMRARYGKNMVWKSLSFLGLKPKYRGDDWNYWWRQQFQNYEFLPKTVENAIELGCGPYTNMRLIIEGCTPRHLFLSDPLIGTYLDFTLTFVSESYRMGLAIIDDHPIEKCPFALDYFDLTVMVNVLDHVQDAELRMTNAMNIVKPGGILIIGQDLTNEEDMRRPEVRNDIGHPIRIGHDWLDGFLIGKVEKIIHNVLPRELGRNPQAHYGTYIFAGKKLA